MNLEEIIKEIDSWKIDFFNYLYDAKELKEIGIYDLSKEELCILVQHLAVKMHESIENWEGG